MDFRISTDIRLTPRAAAVARVPASSDQRPRRFGTSCALGDVVRVAPSDVPLVVIGRQWKIEPDSETLVVVLDLLDEPAPPREIG